MLLYPRGVSRKSCRIHAETYPDSSIDRSSKQRSNCPAHSCDWKARSPGALSKPLLPPPILPTCPSSSGDHGFQRISYLAATVGQWPRKTTATSAWWQQWRAASIAKPRGPCLRGSQHQAKKDQHRARQQSNQHILRRFTRTKASARNEGYAHCCGVLFQTDHRLCPS